MTMALVGCGSESLPIRVPALNAESESPRFNWTLIYYLPYDNDLSPAVDPIVSSLGQTPLGPTISIVVLADRFGPGGMERIVITSEGSTKESLDSEESADARLLSSHLDWATKHYAAHRYGLFLLNHGGEVDQYGLDQYHARGRESWMLYPAIAAAIARWSDLSGTELDLLYLQQCGRANLETLDLLRDSAGVIVAAQTLLGVPNAYYPGTLEWLAEHPHASGVELADVILWEESSQMFFDLTAFDAARVPNIVDHFERLLARLEPSMGPQPDDAMITFQIEEQNFVDAVLWLRARYEHAGLDRAPVDDFAHAIENELILERRISPPHRNVVGHWSGISLVLDENIPVWDLRQGKRAWHRDPPR